MSDGTIASKFFDGVIFIVRECHSRSDLLRAAIHNLEFVGVRLLGFLYTGGGGKRRKRYGKYGSGYGYGYGYGTYGDACGRKEEKSNFRRNSDYMINGTRRKSGAAVPEDDNGM